MEDDLAISEGHSIWLLLGLTYSAILKHRERDLKALGISTRRSWILWGFKYIGRPATITDVSQLLNRDHLTTSQLLKRMEKEGLIKRCGDSQKRSPLKLVMTSKGEDILHRSFEKMAQIDEIMLSLNQEERGNLKSYLNRLLMEAMARSTFITPFSLKSNFNDR